MNMTRMPLHDRKTDLGMTLKGFNYLTSYKETVLKQITRKEL